MSDDRTVITEIEIIDENIAYLLWIGYSYLTYKNEGLYLRLFKKDNINYPLCGSWLANIEAKDEAASFIRVLKDKPNLMQKCLEEAKRIEKIKSFA